ncbi:hypothetical protein SCYAM73S_03868 [Streptomyces cyaneofuscatus]
MRAPSARLNAPLTTAAATSPWLWPTTAEGSTPQARHIAARPTYIANNAGCTTSVRVKGGATPSCPRTIAATENPVYGARASSQAVTASRNASFCSHSARPIPHHWAPWPGKTNATRPRSAAAPVTTVSWLSSAASARRPAAASSVVPAITTPRVGWCVRVVASE